MGQAKHCDRLIVNLALNTGSLKYGATGFLYGLGNDGIPSINLLVPLKPQVAAQKPEGGLQHPNGDALNVSGTYRSAGGREIEIYLQDCYPKWPYYDLGIEDYLEKVVAITRQVVTSPNRYLFSFVPFNEPDQIWYNKSDKKQKFLADWLAVVREIKSIDPSARIVGPNFARYDSIFYRDFLVFGKDHACLPDVISWHELNDDFFNGWTQRYEDYRRIEAGLGIPPREICINEYGRISGDLGIPGKLVQWIARFENSKVDACLAYWADAGSLDSLGARDAYNQATGAWWLYRWYAEMSGHTVAVLPPDADAEGLQGLACVDSQKKEARIVLGGSTGRIDVVVNGFDSVAFFGDRVQVGVSAAASTGFLPSGGPTLVQEGDYPIANGQITVSIDPAEESTAYQVLITPLRDPIFVNLADEETLVTADHNGFYQVRLRYSARPGESRLSAQILRMKLNGAALIEIPIPPGSAEKAQGEVQLTVFLMTGINRIAFNPGEDRDGLAISSIEITPGSGPVASYEAEDQILSGTAAVIAAPAASGGKFVGKIGNGAANALQFNRVTVPESGIYRMVVHFSNAEFRGGHAYNSQVVDRFAEISVNDRSPQKVYFRNTFDWNHYKTREVSVDLAAGQNTIRFFNSTGEAYAPHIDKIEIAAPVHGEPVVRIL